MRRYGRVQVERSGRFSATSVRKSARDTHKIESRGRRRTDKQLENEDLIEIEVARLFWNAGFPANHSDAGLGNQADARFLRRLVTD